MARSTVLLSTGNPGQLPAELLNDIPARQIDAPECKSQAE
jgi:hypothetical protein